jgi:NADPH-dependent ferric siderophore reductase
VTNPASTSPSPSPRANGQRKRVPKTAVVASTARLTPEMVRVVFTGEDLRSLPELTFTDHYIKILFPPAGADYCWPFDLEAIRGTRPSEQWPVTRTYTIRSFNRAANEMVVDFVIHGDEGLAGPWAAQAAPGDQVGFFGPGGAYAPDGSVESHLLVGDEAAIPAIAATLERLPVDARVQVFLEVEGPQHQQPIPTTSKTTIHWVHRAGTGLDHGQALARSVRRSALPAGPMQAFVHGNAEMVRDLRRFLFVEHQVDRRQVSISGYWRSGHTEDGWQASKREFNQQMENEESAQSVAALSTPLPSSS